MIVTYNYYRKEEKPYLGRYRYVDYFIVGDYTCEFEDFQKMITNPKFRRETQCGHVKFRNGDEWIFNWFFGELRFHVLRDTKKTGQINLFGYRDKKNFHGITQDEFFSKYQVGGNG